MRSVALVMLAGLTSCVIPTGGGGLKQIERRQLTAAEPAPLETTKPWTKDPREIKVRVWVDEDFRSQNVRWSKQIEEQLDDANQFLVPALGVRLAVAKMEKWDVRTADRSMGEILQSLETRDDGADVGWVIAYVSSLSLASDSFEQLGVAHALGKHLVVRGYADRGERKAFSAAFPRTTGAERERVHQMRRRHKQTVVLIHEIGHTLGGIHETDEGWIMHAAYSPHMSQFSDRGRELMQIAIDEMVKPAREQDARAAAGRMVGYLDANPWGGWDAADRDELMTYLRALMSSGPSGDEIGSMAAPDIPVPAAAYDQFRRAQTLAQQGKSAEALAELEVLVAAYPGTAEIRQAICEVHIGQSGAGSAKATTACERAAEVSPDDPRPYLARVEAFVRADERAKAFEMLPRAAERAGERAPVWDRIAGIYQAMGAVTLAEAAAAKSAALGAGGVPHPVAEWAARTRARYGLPPDGARWKIKPADEGTYVAAVRELLDLVYAGKMGDAAKKAAAAERRWKGAPGLLAARCDLSLRKGDKGQAKRLCAQAVAAWKGTAWALYLEGVIGLQEHKDARAVASLRAAIAADPELSQAYRALGRALSRTKDDAGWQALAGEYRQKFGQALPR